MQIAEAWVPLTGRDQAGATWGMLQAGTSSEAKAQVLKKCLNE